MSLFRIANVKWIYGCQVNSSDVEYIILKSLCRQRCNMKIWFAQMTKMLLGRPILNMNFSRRREYFPPKITLSCVWCAPFPSGWHPARETAGAAPGQTLKALFHSLCWKAFANQIILLPQSCCYWSIFCVRWRGGNSIILANTSLARSLSIASTMELSTHAQQLLCVSQSCVLRHKGKTDCLRFLNSRYSNLLFTALLSLYCLAELHLYKSFVPSGLLRITAPYFLSAFCDTLEDARGRNQTWPPVKLTLWGALPPQKSCACKLKHNGRADYLYAPIHTRRFGVAAKIKRNLRQRF